MTTDEIRELIESKDIYVEDVWDTNVAGAIKIVAEGDWRHTHMAIQQIMLEAGYGQIMFEDLDFDGDDWGTAEHTYVPVNSKIWEQYQHLQRIQSFGQNK